MTRNPLNLAVASLLLASIALTGCKKKDDAVVADTAPAATEPAPMPSTTPEPMPVPSTPAPSATSPAASALNVTMVDVGSAVGADNKVTTATTMFTPKDTIYVVVNTDGMATNVPITAKWTYQDGQVVGTETKTLNANGPATTEFHASKASGWPAGSYKVELSSNGAVLQTKDFTVK